MDSDYYTCGTCKHGNLYDQCKRCEAEFTSKQRKLAAPATKPVQPTQTKGTTK